MYLTEIPIIALASLVGLVVISYIVETLRRAPGRPEKLAWAPGIPIEYVDIGGVRVRYIKTGTGRALVLLHTLRTQLDLWNMLRPDVQPGSHVDYTLPPEEVAVHLGALVDKSLVQFADAGAGPGRYRLLETVRQYAAGRLDALGPGASGAARVAHRDYYLALAEAAAPQLTGADQAAWLDRLDAEVGGRVSARIRETVFVDASRQNRRVHVLRVIDSLL